MSMYKKFVKSIISTVPALCRLLLNLPNDKIYMGEAFSPICLLTLKYISYTLSLTATLA